MRQYPRDDDLERILNQELDCYYQPSLVGRSAHEWLATTLAFVTAG